MDPQGIVKAFPKRKKSHADLSSKALAKIPKREVGEARGEPVHPHTLERSAFLFSARVRLTEVT
jgi:hypothetical protein